LFNRLQIKAPFLKLSKIENSLFHHKILSSKSVFLQKKEEMTHSEKIDLKSLDKEVFKFKQFEIEQTGCAMKVGTDGVLLGSWADTNDCDGILDIGTGTGVIAIMLAQKAKDATVDAIEIDENAASTAKKNMEQSPFQKRLTCHNDSIQNYSKYASKSYDLIVCNPPFFTGGTLSTHQNRNDVRHTIKLPNGELLSSTRRLLKADGRFCVILPFLEGLRFKEIAKSYNLHCTKMVEVKPKADKSVERLLLQFEKEPKELQTSELIIQFEERNHYTEDYIALTKDFYLKM